MVQLKRCTKPIAKKLIEEIVSEQITLKEKNPFFQLNLINTQNLSSDPSVGQSNPFPGPHTPLKIPNKMVGLIIGRNGDFDCYSFKNLIK